MEEQLKDLLMRKAEEKNVVLDDDDFADNDVMYELFERWSKTIQQSEPERHRWFTLYDVVRKITVGGQDYFYEEVEWDVHGESASAEDCGWECPDLNDLVRVYPKEVTTIAYVTADKL